MLLLTYLSSTEKPPKVCIVPDIAKLNNVLIKGNKNEIKKISQTDLLHISLQINNCANHES